MFNKGENMGTVESRKEKRISINELPLQYASFSILLPHGIESTVYTIDASFNGFGFISELPTEEFIVGHRLVLYPIGNEHPVYGNIVFCSKVDKGSRVGVQLLPLGGYNLYKIELQEIINKIQPTKKDIQ